MTRCRCAWFALLVEYDRGSVGPIDIDTAIENALGERVLARATTIATSEEFYKRLVERGQGLGSPEGEVAAARTFRQASGAPYDDVDA
jgi:hypothetical protein